MNYKKMEKEVIENSYFLNSQLDKYIKKHKNQYAVFNAGKIDIVQSYKEGVELGKKKYGEKIGFIVKKITDKTPVFSSFVCL